MSEGPRPSPEITAFIDGLGDIIKTNPIPDEGDFDGCAKAAEQIWKQLSPLIGYLVKHERRHKDSVWGKERRTEPDGFGLKNFRERGFGSSGTPASNLGKAEAKGMDRPPLPVGEKPINLSNASVGQRYEDAVDISAWQNPRVEGGGGSGIDIAIDGGHVRFSGVPHTHGSFQVCVSGLRHGQPAELKANLFVNPDPRELWRNEPSDQNAKFAKPDEAFAMVDGPLFGAGASKRGRSHAHEGSYRDDDFGLPQPTASGWQIAVVADGAGSAPLSRLGSQLAVATILERLPLRLEESLEPEIERLTRKFVTDGGGPGHDIKKALYETLVDAAVQAAKAIEDQAMKAGRPASDFSTTLIACIARKVSAGWFFAGFSIGDGGAAVLNVEEGIEREPVTILASPDSGAFAGQTRFLHSSELEGGYEALVERIFFDVRERFSALLVMTDGITDPMFPTEATYSNAGQWKALWLDELTTSVQFRKDNAELQEKLLGWLDFWSKGNHDDRTLVVLVPGDAADQ